MIEHQIRVRYAETDQMGVAHHGSYIPWLEEARIESMRKIGISYCDLEQQGIGMPVIDLQISYKRGLAFDDCIILSTHVEIIVPSRIVFHTDISKDQRLCARAAVTVATVNADGVPMRIPDDLRAQLQSIQSESIQSQKGIT